MATWTSEDIAAVRAAIVALGTGSRVASVSFAGPPARTVSYAAVQLGELRSLLASMESQAGSTVPRFRRAGFSKGF